MTVILDLEPNLEWTLRIQAEKADIDFNQNILITLEAQSKKDKAPSVLPAQEAKLLKRINKGFNADFWNTYHDLIQKRQEESIDKLELEQLKKMTTDLELMNTKRLENLTELAQIRKVSLIELMKNLGIVDLMGRFNKKSDDQTNIKLLIIA